MARRALPLLLLLAVVVVAVAAAPFDGETIELGSRRWLQSEYLGAVAPAEAPTADAASDMPYISYGALSAGTTPCGVRGASYYNCRPGAEANSYERGCSSITLCRG